MSTSLVRAKGYLGERLVTIEKSKESERRLKRARGVPDYPEGAVTRPGGEQAGSRKVLRGVPKEERWSL